MPRGGARPGAGRKPKTLQELKLSGSFRPHRHGHLLAGPGRLPSRPAAAASVKPVAGDGGLGAVGQAFVDAVLGAYEGFDEVELALVRLAARTLDDEAAAPSAVERQRAARTFASLAQQLGLGKAK